MNTDFDPPPPPSPVRYSLESLACAGFVCKALNCHHLEHNLDSQALTTNDPGYAQAPIVVSPPTPLIPCYLESASYGEFGGKVLNCQHLSHDIDLQRLTATVRPASRSTDNRLLTADNCFSKSFFPVRTLGAAAKTQQPRPRFHRYAPGR